MKIKIKYLIIGIVIGVIITSCAFLVKENNKEDSNNGRPEFDKNFKDFSPDNLPEGFDPSNRPRRQNNKTQTTE